jgi:hypothetical protein
MVKMSKFKMGRIAPDPQAPKLLFSNYKMPGMVSPPRPATPAWGDYTPAAMAAIRRMYLNNQLGDCVCAWMGHSVGIVTGNAGGPAVQFTDEQIQQLYSAIGGYVPGNPATDQGCDEITAMNYWRDTGVFGHKIAGWLAVDPVDADYALNLFEILTFGVAMPNAWINPEPEGDGFVWDIAGPANPMNGHCFGGGAWNSKGIVICTWGMLGTITDRAVAYYTSANSGGGLYTAISQEAINKGKQKAPNGFAWDDLVADFKAAGGTVTTP